MMHVLYPRRWIVGMPADFWIKNIPMVKEAIQKYGLEPVASESLVQKVPFAPLGFVAGEPEKDPSILRIRPFPFPGGIRTPHLHSEKDVYLLSDDQWKDFSGMVIKDFQAKLARVNSVNFEQVMEIAETMDSLV